MTWKPDYVPPKRGRGSKISPKMLLFVDEYMLDLNGTAAVLRAGYGVSPKNANRKAAELMQHPHVKAEIEKRTTQRAERLELSAEYVINKLIDIVENTDTSNPTAALRGLELLGKNLGLFKERQEISGPDGEAIRMEQKVNENVEDFTRKLARLSSAGGAGTVLKFAKPSGESET